MDHDLIIEVQTFKRLTDAKCSFSLFILFCSMFFPGQKNIRKFEYKVFDIIYIFRQPFSPNKSDNFPLWCQGLDWISSGHCGNGAVTRRSGVFFCMNQTHRIHGIGIYSLHFSIQINYKGLVNISYMDPMGKERCGP